MSLVVVIQDKIRIQLVLFSLVVFFVLGVVAAHAEEAATNPGDQYTQTAIGFRAPSSIHTQLLTGNGPYERPGARGSRSKKEKKEKLPEVEYPAELQKSPPRAFLYSMILPGWGQRYVDRPIRGAIYTGVEVSLWTGILLSWQSYLYQTDNYEKFAIQHAGVSGDHESAFYADIGNYNNINDYNAAKRQQRDYEAQYDIASEYWNWDSSSNRHEFDDIRISAGRHKNRIYYLAGGMLINRLISAIDAARTISNAQKKYRESLGEMHVGWLPEAQGPALVWSWRGNLF